MDRKQFLKGLAGAGIALGALSAFGLGGSRPVQLTRVRLPASRGHVRHGLLSPIESVAGIGAGVTLFQEDIFYGNGFASGPGDWRQFTFGNARGRTGLLLKGEEIWLSDTSRMQALALSQPVRVALSNGLDLEVQPVNGSFDLQDAGTDVRLHWMLEGECELGSQNLGGQFAALSEGRGSIQGSTDRRSLLATLSPSRKA